jgi:hypothetical protein
LAKARKRARSLSISCFIYICRKGAVRQLTFYDDEATSLDSTSATWSGFSTMGR